MENDDNNAVDALDVPFQFDAILDRIERTGAVITITREGKPVARLEPISASATRRRAAGIVKAFRRFQKAHPIEGITTRDLIREGRRR